MFCRELLGFQVSVPSVDLLGERAQLGIARHLDWLSANGWQPARSGHLQGTIVERVRKDHLGILPHFSADLSPPTPAEVRDAQRISAVAQRELIGVYRRFGTDRVVETQAFGEVTLGDLLRMVAELDGWYLGCLTRTPPIPLPDDPARAITAADRHFRRHLAASYDAFRGRRDVDARKDDPPQDGPLPRARPRVRAAVAVRGRWGPRLTPGAPRGGPRHPAGADRG